MKRTGMRTVFLIRIYLTCFCFLGLMTLGLALQAQESKPQPPEKKQGTGVGPPGVKLGGQMPAGSTPRPYRFPKAATKTLANGIRVFVLSDAEQPAVTVRLVLPAAGSIHDPAAKPGVAEM